jgi:hypothetical protein
MFVSSFLEQEVLYFECCPPQLVNRVLILLEFGLAREDVRIQLLARHFQSVPPAHRL